MKNVASVTMKLGNLVFITMKPLNRPMHAAKANVMRIAGHMLKPHSVVSRPSSRPVVPVIAPADRSNSPPIISSATTTAMMPSVEATSVQLATPPSVRKLSAVTAKNSPTASAPISAPSSGRRSSRVARLTSASRSSTTLTGSGATSPSCLVCSAQAVLGELLDLGGAPW